MSEWFKLKVDQIEQETPHSRTIKFDVTEEELHKFQFKPGQFIGLKMEVNGQDEERSYSLSSSSIDEGLCITVKKVEGGKVSAHIVDVLQEGDELLCAPPEGRFTITADPSKRRKHFFIAAGSGITPIYSLIRYILNFEPKSEVYLLYGNRTEEDVIFNAQLQTLEEQFRGQFFVKHVFSAKKPSRWKIFSISDDEDWTGRIDSKKLNRWLKKNSDQQTETHYYICGPGNMNLDLYEYLKNKGIPAKQIHVESFMTAQEFAAREEGTIEGTFQLEVQLNGERKEISLTGNKPILEALLDEGLPAPHSCTSGACASCMAKVVEGEVAMDVDFALSDEEKEEGYVLTCQARPVSYRVSINYDV